MQKAADEIKVDLEQLIPSLHLEVKHSWNRERSARQLNGNRREIATPPEMIGQPRCKRNDCQCRGCVSGRREDSATSEEQIVDPIDPAIRVDHAVGW